VLTQQSASRFVVARAALLQGDLADADALRAGASGADAVFHCAWAGLDMRGELSALRRNNVDGLRNAARAAAAAGARRFVFVSSEAVLFGAPIVDADERTPTPSHPSDFVYKGGDNPYSVTKREAEAWLLSPEGSAALGMDIIIVRPRLIWGRDDTTVTPQLVALARSGALSLMGGAGARHVFRAMPLLRAHFRISRRIFSPGMRASGVCVCAGRALATWTTWWRECCSPQRAAAPARRVLRPASCVCVRGESEREAYRAWRVALRDAAWRCTPRVSSRGVPPGVRHHPRAASLSTTRGAYIATRRRAEAARSAAARAHSRRLAWGALTRARTHASLSTQHTHATCRNPLFPSVRPFSFSFPPQKVYFLTDGPPAPAASFYAALATAASGAPPRLPAGLFPPSVLSALVSLFEALQKLSRGRFTPPLTHADACAFGREVSVRDGKARAQLGYAPRPSCRARGLADVARARERAAADAAADAAAQAAADAAGRWGLEELDAKEAARHALSGKEE
jgi:hypothetical protein